MKDCIKIENPKECCGCGACKNICPKNAITMEENEMGFFYPVVDEELCINCGLCKTVCVFSDKHTGENKEASVYAAASKNTDTLMSSSSGGLFTELASAVIDKGGAVFGAAWSEDFSLHHIAVTKKSDLNMLRGSKYVQSSTDDTYSQAKKMLDNGMYVCYCGTPCQIAGLKAFLKKDYDKLLTLDLICHGVPSVKMLQQDLEYVSKKKKINITDVKFRDKGYGWGVTGSLSNGTSKVKYDSGVSPYYFYFLNGEIYRESCYNCRFPSEGRQGDITLGDYWGINQELVKQMGDVDLDKGVSCILVNSEKGRQWINQIKDSLFITSSDRKSAEKRNKQLTHASVPTPEHNALSAMYKEKEYEAFVYWYKKNYKKHIIHFIKSLIPRKTRRRLMQVYSKIKG